MFDELLTLDGEIIRVSRKVASEHHVVTLNCTVQDLRPSLCGSQSLKSRRETSSLESFFLVLSLSLSLSLSHLTVVRVYDKEPVPPFC